MEDRELMERELNLIKGVSTLYLHGAVESETQEVHEAFKCALDQSLNIQNHIYNLMKQRGWYNPETTNQMQMDKVKQKFNG